MIRFIKMAGLAATAMFLGLAVATPANAQATRTWISGVGDDVNPCSRTAPCKTWAGAISKTAAGGEIDCLDPGGFGSVTITKSITLDCAEAEGGSAGGILNAGVAGVIINDVSALGITVVLRNLNIQGTNSASRGTYGVRFISGKSLTMQNVTITNVGNGSFPAVSFESSVANSQLVMSHVFISNATSVGVLVKTINGVTATASLDNVTITDTDVGVQVEDGGTATIMNSNISHNRTTGVATVSTTLPAVVNIDRSVLTSNVTGVLAGTGTTVRLSGVSIYSSNRGLKASGTGAIISFGNNTLGPDAGAAGLPTSTVTLK